MLGRPFHHEAQRSRRYGAVDYCECLNRDLHRAALVGCVKVRRVVVRVVESDHNPEEAAEFCH